MWARILGERRPLQLAMIVLLTGCVVVAGVFVLIAAFSGRPTFFTVDTQTEYLEISGFSDKSSLVLDGFAICYDADNSEPSSNFLPSREQPCGPQSRLLDVPQGAALDIVPGSLAFVRRLARGPLEIAVNGSVNSHPDFDVSVWVLRSFEPLSHTVGFDVGYEGWVHLGQIPDSGIEGILISGGMSAYQKGMGGRFRVNSTNLIAGDVVDIALPEGGKDDCRTEEGGVEEGHPIQGFFRFETPELEGLRVVVYVLCAERLNVERMGTHFPFLVTWTAQMLGDPFSTAVLAFISWLGCIAAVVALVVGPVGTESSSPRCPLLTPGSDGDDSEPDPPGGDDKASGSLNDQHVDKETKNKPLSPPTVAPDNGQPAKG